MSAALVAVPAVPLVAAALVATARPSWRAAGALTCAASAMALILLLGSRGGSVEVPWLEVGRWDVSLGLRADGLAWTAALLVAAVSLVVNVYSLGYMAHGGERRRFFGWMAFFEGAMLALVLASSLVLLFVAWEAVGLASWALIAHEDRDPAARRAGAQALLATRLGDMGLLLAIAIALWTTGTSDVAAIGEALRGGVVPETIVLGLALLLLLASLAKSAQLPFTGWLPDAMVGPAPVSALIHSATMVAAGVFLLLRLWPVLEAAPPALAALRWIGGVTAVAAALAATAEDDLKRVLAWSTVDQLGLMMLSMGAGVPLAAGVHLVLHGLFKAALFLDAGALDRATGTRSLRRLGGLGRALPWTAAAFVAAAGALAGVPPLSGFVSGELGLGAAARIGAGWGALAVALVLLAAIAIARAAGAAFLRRAGAARASERPGLAMEVPLVFLAATSAVAGLLLRDPLEAALPFGAGPEPALPWRAAAVGATIAGLALGLARARRRGAAPALGLSFAAIPATADALLRWPAVAVASAGRGIDRLERWADAAARAVGGAAGALGRAIGTAERSGFDRAARRLAATVAASAGGVDAVERRVIAAGVDAVARDVGRLGGIARRAQSGRISAYLGAVAAVVLLAIALTAGAAVVATLARR